MILWLKVLYLLVMVLVVASHLYFSGRILPEISYGICLVLFGHNLKKVFK